MTWDHQTPRRKHREWAPWHWSCQWLFINLTPKAKPTKLNKSVGLHQTKKLLFRKGNNQKMNRQPMEWDTIFANHIFLLPQNKPVAFKSHSPLTFPLVSIGNYSSTFCLYRLIYSCHFIYKWNHTIRGALWLASLALHVFKVNPYCAMDHTSFLLMNNLHLMYI